MILGDIAKMGPHVLEAHSISLGTSWLVAPKCVQPMLEEDQLWLVASLDEGSELLCRCVTSVVW